MNWYKQANGENIMQIVQSYQNEQDLVTRLSQAGVQYQKGPFPSPLIYKVIANNQPFIIELPYHELSPMHEYWGNGSLDSWLFDDGEKTLDQVASILDFMDIEYQKMEFPRMNQEYLVVIYDGTSYMVDTYSVKETIQWIYDNSEYAELYLPERPEYSDDFWQNPPGVVYHGTSEEKLNSILENGLEARNETRGISNRHTSSAVFTSENIETALSSGHYDVILEINVDQMKRDGYMPRVSAEEPLQEAQAMQDLAHLLGVDNDHYFEGDGLMSSDGLAEDTIIFFGDIPAKYIRVYEG